MKQRQKVNYEPYAARTHCSKSCGLKSAHKKRQAKKKPRPENKICQVCSKNFGRVTYTSGAIEPYTKYLKKKVCSYDCKRELIKRTNLEKTGDLVKLARLRFTSKVQQWFSPGLAK